jgi:dTDP-4-dehydrorhamnose reductase
MMRVLIFGRTGQVARELERAQWPKKLVLRFLDRAACDLTDPAAARRAIVHAQPQIVINAAAYTAVDRAEGEPHSAGLVNRDAPAAMAEACAKVNAILVHLSTDYVFDGSKPGAYIEEDPVAPISVYGRTKAEGETAIRSALERHVILRTSWVFAAHGSNFVRTMLRLASERPELRIVSDQRGAPTAARDIANAIVVIANAIAAGNAASGTFHFTSSRPTTWYDFARTIFDLSGREISLVPITTAEYTTAAQRPMNSVLYCGWIARDYAIPQPSWRKALADVLAEMGQTNAPRATIP